MDADIEARVRELEIASSVHSINTKQTELNVLQLVKGISDIRENDIKPIKEQINKDLGKKNIIATIATIAIVGVIGYQSWVSLSIIESKLMINGLKNEDLVIHSEINKIENDVERFNHHGEHGHDSVDNTWNRK